MSTSAPSTSAHPSGGRFRPANELPRRGIWVRVVIDLADGSTVELTLPRAVAGAVAGYSPSPGEEPSLVLIRSGQRRRARLGALFGI